MNCDPGFWQAFFLIMGIGAALFIGGALVFAVRNFVVECKHTKQDLKWARKEVDSKASEFSFNCFKRSVQHDLDAIKAMLEQNQSKQKKKK